MARGTPPSAPGRAQTGLRPGLDMCPMSLPVGLPMGYLPRATEGERQLLRMMRPELHPSRLRALLVAGAVSAGRAAAPAVSEAATASYASGTITVTTARDETNRMTVAPWGVTLTIADAGTKGKKDNAITVTAGS